MRLILCFAGGVLLGGLFYGGLRLTVRRMILARRPLLMAVTSFLIRLALVAAGLVFISRGGLGCLAVAFFGFFLVRILMTRQSLRGGTRGTQP